MPSEHRCNEQRPSEQLVVQLREWARELGFSQIGIGGVDLSSAEPGLLQWLAAGFHGDMAYMEAHGLKRARPAELLPGTVSVISARMDYLPRGAGEGWLADEESAARDAGRALVSVYARGRDYHKVLRSRLAKLADRLRAEVGPLGHRVFTDSAPVLEVELAARAGLGWRGKHTLLLSREAGSMFFLGEIFLDLALPHDQPLSAHCGQCAACISACPTSAIVAPYRLDARRCISYLTIEQDGPIPVDLRSALGNRIYGCDDCQRACPWNKYAQRSALPDFDVRGPLAQATLLQLWAWDEAAFLLQDREFQAQQAGLALASTPVPPDAKVAEFLAGLEAAKKPIVIDATLAQLRRDADLSRTQLTNRRLVAAQDLAWALINSPAFLFNH